MLLTSVNLFSSDRLQQKKKPGGHTHLYSICPIMVFYESEVFNVLFLFTLSLLFSSKYLAIFKKAIYTSYNSFIERERGRSQINQCMGNTDFLTPVPDVEAPAPVSAEGLLLPQPPRPHLGLARPAHAGPKASVPTAAASTPVPDVEALAPVPVHKMETLAPVPGHQGPNR